MLNTFIMTFQEHPLAWTRVDVMLENSTSNETKYFALSVLDSAIKFRWNSLPVPQRSAIRDYIFGLVIKHSASEELMAQQRTFVGRLNLILVQVCTPPALRRSDGGRFSSTSGRTTGGTSRRS